MRSFIALLFLFSLKSVACSEEVKDFAPFAIEVEAQQNSQQDFKVFEILSPTQKGAEFLSSITARVKGEFQVNLDIHEDNGYMGNFYRSYINVAPKHIDEIEIIFSYNTTKKDRSDIILCGNWKAYKLTKLVSFEPAKEVPLLPKTKSKGAQ